MGGYICHEIMRQAPERVTRLALLDTSARPDSPEQTRTRSGFLLLAKTGRFKGITPQLIPYLLHPDNHQDKALVVRLMAMAEEIGRDGYLQQQTARSEEHTSELQSLIRISYAVFCLKKKKHKQKQLIQ